MDVSFRSVVISLSAASPGPHTLRLAAELARLIGADLRGLYVEDAQLLDVADLPFARELDPLRPQAQRWRPLARDQLARDFELAAAALRRRLSEIARSAGVPVEFTVMRADPQRSLPSLLDELRAQGGFVLVVPADRPARGEPQPTGAVLYAPTGAHRRGSEVIALTPAADSTIAPLAERIARGAHARCVVLEAHGDAEQLQHALDGRHERLIVAAPSAFAHADDPAVLAALRRSPVLVVPELTRT